VRRVLAGTAVVAATLALSRASREVDLFRFPLCWWGVLLALDGAVRLRHGASALPRAADWVRVCTASIVFWDVFELVNLRLRDWWYAGVPRDALAGAAFSAICFATVLPAARLGSALLAKSLSAGIARAEARPRRAPWLLFAGAFALGLALVFPTVAFPLAWVFLWPLAEGALALRADAEPRLSSPLQALRAGDRSVAVRLLAIALPMGLLWESLNWRSARGWFYTVPHFASHKLFEMPLPGYLGYLPFLLEVGAALAIVDRIRPKGSRAVLAVIVLLLVHAAIDRVGREHTAASVAALSAAPKRSGDAIPVLSPDRFSR
jgi:hypothetical protein